LGFSSGLAVIGSREDGFLADEAHILFTTLLLVTCHMSLKLRSPQFLVSEFTRVWTRIVRYDLPFSQQLPLVNHQAVEADGASGVDFAGATK